MSERMYKTTLALAIRCSCLLTLVASACAARPLELSSHTDLSMPDLGTPRPSDLARPQANDLAPACTMPFVSGDDWTGSYTCPQGLTNLTLHIGSVSGVSIDAIFEFDYVPSNTSGSYALTGSFDETTQQASFTPGAWLSQPPGWTSVGMLGTVQPGCAVYSGQITYVGCGSFTVQH